VQLEELTVEELDAQIAQETGKLEGADKGTRPAIRARRNNLRRVRDRKVAEATAASRGLDKLTVQELDDQIVQENARLESACKKSKEQLDALYLVRDTKLAEAAAAKDVAGMSPAKRRAMAALIRPAGIASTAKVGTPGKK
jgi:hypothetical protein